MLRPGWTDLKPGVVLLAVALGLGSCVELFAIQRGFCHLGLAVVTALVAFATAAVAALGAVLTLLLLGALVALLLVTALGIAADRSTDRIAVAGVLTGPLTFAGKSAPGPMVAPMAHIALLGYDGALEEK